MEYVLEKLDYCWGYERTETTSFMLGVAFIDDTTRVKAYRPYEASQWFTEEKNEKILNKWWNENRSDLEEVIMSQYDCTGRWFSAYQENEGATWYDIQYLDV